jgi:hypothetical protein
MANRVTCQEPALNKAEMIVWGKQLYAEAQGVDRIQLEGVVRGVLGESQVNGYFVFDNLTTRQVVTLNRAMFRIARFSY